MSVITISRQVGSGGDAIAELVAQKLGYELMTQEKVHQLAKECDLDFKKACHVFEKEVPPGFWDRLFFSDPLHTSLFESLNLQLAGQDNVVILGRGAQIVLADIPGVLRVRIVAPVETRVTRLMEEKGLSYDEAAKFEKMYGRQRRHLIESVFHCDLADWSLYDLVINTNELSNEACAATIALAAREKAEQTDENRTRKLLADMEMAKKIQLRIKKELPRSILRSIDVWVQEDGSLQLAGFVRSRSDKDLAESIARGFPGVPGVDNKLVVIEFVGE